MAQKAKRGLGRGFEALISQDFDQSLLLTAEDRVESIPVDRLEPNPHQPRTHFDQAALNELSQSIKQYGVVQPLVVTPVKDGKYTLVAGERRWRASKLAGLKTVPAIIRGRQELETLEIALIENVQRVDLSPLEQAVSIERLHEQFNLSYDQIAKRLGKASSTVNNTVRLLQLPANARTALAGAKEPAAHHERVQTETPATKQLSKKLGAPVNIRRTARGGKLEIGFKDDAELDRLLDLFS
jgi:ParB family chromosome partitioning protein